MKPLSLSPALGNIRLTDLQNEPGGGVDVTSFHLIEIKIRDPGGENDTHTDIQDFGMGSKKTQFSDSYCRAFLTLPENIQSAFLSVH